MKTRDTLGVVRRSLPALVVTLTSVIGAGCGAIPGLSDAAGAAWLAEPPIEADTPELAPSVGSVRVSHLPNRYRGGRRGLTLTDWLGFEVSSDYREERWALGYASLRVYGGRAIGGSEDWSVSAQIASGAGAGVGGAQCLVEERCASVGDGERWYQGVAYGAFLSAGAALRYRAVSFFTTSRFQITRAWVLDEAYRFLVALGVQIQLPEGLRVYAIGGYLAEWTGASMVEGVEVEVGLQLRADLWRQFRERW